MPNGEIICAGKTIGWTTDKVKTFAGPSVQLGSYLREPEQTFTQERVMRGDEQREIARQISEVGNSSGILDSADGYRCAWELKANIFKN